MVKGSKAVLAFATSRILKEGPEGARQSPRKSEIRNLPMTYHYAEGQRCNGDGKAAALLSNLWRYPPLGSCVSHPGTYILVSL